MSQAAIADYWIDEYHNKRHPNELPSFATFVHHGKKYVLDKDLETVCTGPIQTVSQSDSLSVEKPSNDNKPRKTTGDKVFKRKQQNSNGQKLRFTHGRAPRMENKAVKKLKRRVKQGVLL